MTHVDLETVWANSPIGITVYEPIYQDGKLDSMKLAWINAAVSSRIELEPSQMLGWSVGQVIGDENWHSLRERYQELVSGPPGASIGYARTYDNPTQRVTFDYQVTAWWAPPWVCIQVREVSSDALPYKDKRDIEAALRLVDARSKQTLELAQLLTAKRPPA